MGFICLYDCRILAELLHFRVENHSEIIDDASISYPQQYSLNLRTIATIFGKIKLF